MIKAQIKISDAGKRLIKKAFKELEVKELLQDLLDHLQKLSQITATYVVKRGLSGDILKRRTGGLARSVIGRAEVNHGVPAIRVGVLRGPAARYAAIQERGGVVKPKKAGALAVPVGPALTPAGVARWGGPRQAPFKLTFIPINRGQVVGRLVREDDEDMLEDAKSYYLLLKSAKIPASRWLSTPIKEYLPQMSKSVLKFFKEKLGVVSKA